MSRSIRRTWRSFNLAWRRMDTARQLSSFTTFSDYDAAREVADRLHAEGRNHNAWEAQHLSDRLALLNPVLGHSLLRSKLDHQTAEVSKLTDWRRTAANTELAKIARRGPDATTAELRLTVFELQTLLDDHYDTMHLGYEYQTRRLYSAGVLLWLCLLTLWLLISRNWFDGLDEAPGLLRNASAYAAAGLLGLLGACLSMTLGRMNFQRKVPLLSVTKGNSAFLVARLGVGCVGGLLASIAVQEDLVKVLAPGWATLVAVPGGFSERLVRRLVEMGDPLGADTSARKPSVAPPAVVAREEPDNPVEKTPIGKADQKRADNSADESTKLEAHGSPERYPDVDSPETGPSDAQATPTHPGPGDSA